MFDRSFVHSFVNVFVIYSTFKPDLFLKFGYCPPQTLTSLGPLWFSQILCYFLHKRFDVCDLNSHILSGFRWQHRNDLEFVDNKLNSFCKKI